MAKFIFTSIVLVFLVCGTCLADVVAPTFVLHGNGDGIGSQYESEAIVDITRHRFYNQTNPTTLYIHGYQENQDSDTVKTIVQAYTQRGNINLITLNWADEAATLWYPFAVRKMFGVGYKTGGKLFAAFITKALNISNFHVVGHSLGAQMAATIGRAIIERSNGTMLLERISGLDPAGPLFFTVAPSYALHLTLNKTDAKFVDIVHTDRNAYGFPLSTATADFYPNGGARHQPGCVQFQLKTDEDFCSHRRSVDYWAESVINENNFQAIALSNEVSYNFLSWGRFKANADLDYDNVVPMGIACPVTAEGDYYLQTNGTSPFGRSEDGITFDSTI